MVARESTPLVQAVDGMDQAEKAQSWAPLALLGIFYSFTGVCQVFSVFIRTQVAKTINSTPEYVSECQSLFWLGYVASTVMWLPLFDCYGRRIPFFTSGWLGTSAVALSFVTADAWVYGLCQFVIGFFLMPVGNMSWVWASELCPKSWHNGLLAAYNVGYSAMNMGMAGASFALKDSKMPWQGQQGLWYLPFVLALVVGPLVIPESAELMVSEKSQMRSSESLESPSSLLRRPVLQQTLATMVCWFAVATSYYGLSYTSGNLAPNLYLNMGLLALTDLICYATSKPLIDFLGRRQSQMAVFACAAVVLLVCTLQQERSWALMCISLIGRLCLAVAFATVFLLLADFPASLRARALGAANICARLGCASSPLLALAPANAVCMGLAVAAFAASVATWSLEEKH